MAKKGKAAKPVTDVADAFPEKRLFIDMFIRDLSLEDCLLDLLDNSIDSIIPLSANLSHDILSATPSSTPLGEVRITLGKDRIEVKDTGRGISFSHARLEVFRFGHRHGNDNHRLGAYGIGMKRAIFKIGQHFSIQSDSEGGGVEADVDLADWAASDVWQIPITSRQKAANGKTGTVITVTRLRDEISHRLNDKTFVTRLVEIIGKTYCLLLNRFVSVYVNDIAVSPFDIPVGGSDDLSPAIEKFKIDDVQIQIITSVASRQPSGEWKSELAGWYVFCNGRAVLFADKSDATGWGVGSLPFFNTKMRGFIGAVFFSSPDPLQLPWTTTKRGINRENLVYIQARVRMGVMGKQVVRFLDGLYDPNRESDAAEVDREISRSINLIDIRRIDARSPQAFTTPVKKRQKDNQQVKIQFQAQQSDIKLIRDHLGDRKMSASQIGRETFEYYIKSEGLKQ
jgi:hypothetical protein